MLDKSFVSPITNVTLYLGCAPNGLKDGNSSNVPVFKYIHERSHDPLNKLLRSHFIECQISCQVNFKNPSIFVDSLHSTYGITKIPSVCKDCILKLVCFTLSIFTFERNHLKPFLVEALTKIMISESLRTFLHLSPPSANVNQQSPEGARVPLVSSCKPFCPSDLTNVLRGLAPQPAGFPSICPANLLIVPIK